MGAFQAQAPVQHRAAPAAPSSTVPSACARLSLDRQPHRCPCPTAPAAVNGNLPRRQRVLEEPVGPFVGLKGEVRAGAARCAAAAARGCAFRVGCRAVVSLLRQALPAAATPLPFLMSFSELLPLSHMQGPFGYREIVDELTALPWDAAEARVRPHWGVRPRGSPACIPAAAAMRALPQPAVPHAWFPRHTACVPPCPGRHAGPAKRVCPTLPRHRPNGTATHSAFLTTTA